MHTPNGRMPKSIRPYLSSRRDGILSKTGRKGSRPASAFPSAGHVGEVFPWYTCMPTLGARPHSACALRRRRQSCPPPAGCAATFLRFFCDMRNFSRWQPLCPPLRHGEGVPGLFLQQHRVGASDTSASSPQKRENQVIVHFTFGALSGQTLPTCLESVEDGGARCTAYAHYLCACTS